MTTLRESAGAVPERSSVVVVILLSLVTGGVYVPVWFLRRRRWLNRLGSPVTFGIGLPLLMLALQAGLLTISLVNEPYRQQGLHLPAVLALTRLVALLVELVLLIRMAFVVREILSDHLKMLLSALSSNPAEDFVDMSVILTLLFSIGYLQYKINECASFSEQWTAAAAPVT